MDIRRFGNLGAGDEFSRFPIRTLEENGQALRGATGSEKIIVRFVLEGDEPGGDVGISEPVRQAQGKRGGGDEPRVLEATGEEGWIAKARLFEGWVNNSNSRFQS